MQALSRPSGRSRPLMSRIFSLLVARIMSPASQQCLPPATPERQQKAVAGRAALLMVKLILDNQSRRLQKRGMQGSRKRATRAAACFVWL